VFNFGVDIFELETLYSFTVPLTSRDVFEVPVFCGQLVDMVRNKNFGFSSGITYLVKVGLLSIRIKPT
jgi:hypothetical protein